MGVEDEGGFLENPAENERKLRVMIEAAIQRDVYVIVDWHSHHAEASTDQAVGFFARIARDYGHHDHVIYEIYNEPKDSQWNEIKGYAQKVIRSIRKHDPDNLIIVGSGEWSQRVDDPARDPIRGWPNIAYTLIVPMLHWKKESPCLSRNGDQWDRRKPTRKPRRGWTGVVLMKSLIARGRSTIRTSHGPLCGQAPTREEDGRPTIFGPQAS